MNYQVIDGGVTASKGFSTASCAAGIKYKNRTDMAMIKAEVPCAVAGTFTTNLVKAAPVKWDQQVVYDQKKAQAVIINAGIANACTGQEGMDICEKTAEEAAKILNVNKDEVLVASTGVIGMQIPVDRIVNGITMMAPDLDASIEAGHAAAKAIMTTDTVSKEAACCFMIGDKKVTIGGMSKGSGMIHPNMCTMLAFLTTDCAISQELLMEALKADVQETYNMISVDGDTSTNDTCVLMASGLAGNAPITEKGPEFDAFCEALRYVNQTLAMKMAGDGEGATALFEVTIVGAASKEQAKVLAKSVITSSLTKAAIFGHDANCGRVLCAMGYSGAQFDPDKVDLFFESCAGRIQLVDNGKVLTFDEELAKDILSQEKVTAVADVKMGHETATAWGCDLTFDYVKINADYRS